MQRQIESGQFNSSQALAQPETARQSRLITFDEFMEHMDRKYHATTEILRFEMLDAFVLYLQRSFETSEAPHAQYVNIINWIHTWVETDEIETENYECEFINGELDKIISQRYDACIEALKAQTSPRDQINELFNYLNKLNQDSSEHARRQITILYHKQLNQDLGPINEEGLLGVKALREHEVELFEALGRKLLRARFDSISGENPILTMGNADGFTDRLPLVLGSLERGLKYLRESNFNEKEKIPLRPCYEALDEYLSSPSTFPTDVSIEDRFLSNFIEYVEYASWNVAFIDDGEKVVALLAHLRNRQMELTINSSQPKTAAQLGIIWSERSENDALLSKNKKPCCRCTIL